MHEEMVHTLIGRALTEPRFCEVLLRSPNEAIRGLPFSIKERAIIGSVKASSLEEFARRLNRRLSVLQS